MRSLRKAIFMPLLGLPELRFSGEHDALMQRGEQHREPRTDRDQRVDASRLAVAVLEEVLLRKRDLRKMGEQNAAQLGLAQVARVGVKVLVIAFRDLGRREAPLEPIPAAQ